MSIKNSAFLLSLISLCSCTIGTKVDNSPGAQNRYADAGTAQVSGIIGIESQDIISMTDKMVKDMLQNPILNNSKEPAVVIVDEKYFENDSSQRLNKKLIVDRMRSNLFRAAKGRMRFIARHASNMFEHEQKLRQQKVISGGTAKKQAGATYRLTGNFKDHIVNIARGQQSNYVQAVFEMVDLNTGELIWSNLYEFKKISAKESLMYQ